MGLINRHGLPVHILLFPLLHPLLVFPGKAAQISDYGSRPRTKLRIVGKGIRLVQLPAVLCGNQEFIHFARLHPGDKQPPDPHRAKLLHGMRILIPAVEAPDHMHFPGIGRPHAEINSLLAFLHGNVRPQLLINVIMSALRKKILVSLGYKNLFYLFFHYVLTAFHTKSFSVRITISSSS